MDKNERLRKIAEFVQQRKADTTERSPERLPMLNYRWKHTLRVTQYGKQLAEAEGANVELVVAACLLHDIVKFGDEDQGLDHGRIGAKIARPVLQDLGYATADVENMCFAIAMHVDDKADFEHPVTIETKVVSDADNIDRFGAYRIMLHFRKDLDDYDRMISRAEQRILTLKEYRQRNIMATDTGNIYFNRQLDLQIFFLERLIADGQLTAMPEL